MEEQVFNFLVSRFQSRIDHIVMISENRDLDVQEYRGALISLSSKGLIKIDTTDTHGDFIVKTEEFYKAQTLGWQQWNFVFNREKLRREETIKWNQIYYKYRAAAARYWWISIPLSLIAIGISLIKM